MPVIYANTIADLQALDTSGLVDGQGLRVSTTGRAGPFAWRAGDKSAEVSADEVTSGEGDGGG